MAVKVALSTMWAVGRFSELSDFFEAGRRIGFARFELNHAIDSARLAGLALNGTIATVHEPCPADVPMAVLKERDWLVSALDEDNRRQGVAAVRRSIELAQELGAEAVIVHPGRVAIDPAPWKDVLHLYRQGKAGQPEYGQAVRRLVAARSARAEAALSSVRRSLVELAEVAARKGIRLGLENRYHYPEIPLPDELDDLLELSCGQGVGFWYDVGHAQVLHNLGLVPHEEWLCRFGGPQGRLIGVHLHDVVGLTDHLAAGLGRVDWGMVAGSLPANALRTCEFQSTHSPEEVATGVRRLIDARCLPEGALEPPVS